MEALLILWKGVWHASGSFGYRPWSNGRVRRQPGPVVAHWSANCNPWYVQQLIWRESSWFQGFLWILLESLFYGVLPLETNRILSNQSGLTGSLLSIFGACHPDWVAANHLGISCLVLKSLGFTWNLLNHHNFQNSSNCLPWFSKSLHGICVSHPIPSSVVCELIWCPVHVFVGF